MTRLALDEMCVADDVAACLALKLMARYEYSRYIVDRQELFCFPSPFVSFKMFTDFMNFRFHTPDKVVCPHYNVSPILSLCTRGSV